MASEEKGKACQWCSQLGMHCGASCDLPPLAVDHFAAVLRVFGARNLSTLFSEFEPQERGEVAERLVSSAISCEGDGGVDLLWLLLKQSKGDDAVARVVFDDHVGNAAAPPLAKAEEGRAVAKDAEAQQVAAAAPSSSITRDARIEEEIQDPDASALKLLDPMPAPPVENVQVGREQGRAPDKPTSPPRVPPHLGVDCIWEILLRVDPSSPESLVQAKLVCRLWRNVLADPVFLRRYRAFHRTPPLLGIIVNTEDDENNDAPVAVFIPATKFRPSALQLRGYRVLDSRHGRVLLLREDVGRLLVWNPLTGQNRLLPPPPQSQGFDDSNAAVLCAAGTECDHLSCGPGHFLVAMASVEDDRVHAWLFSSQTGQWSAPTSTEPPREGFGLLIEQPAVVSGDFVFFHCDYSTVLTYCTFDASLQFDNIPFMVIEDSCGLAQIRLLPEENNDGLFRLASLYQDTLTLWAIDEPTVSWRKTGVLKLPDLLPLPIAVPAIVAGVSDLDNSIFLLGSNGILSTMDLASFQTTRVGRMSAPVFFYPYYQFI